MRKLNNKSFEYINSMIKDNNLKSILAFCNGYGINTNSFLSPVFYDKINGKLVILYRCTYYHYDVLITALTTKIF